MRRRHLTPDKPSPLLPVIVVACGVLLHWYIAQSPGGFLATGQLADPDSWTRLLRVLALHQGADWQDPRLAALSAPEGLSLHWTRPLDLLILGPARLAMRFGVEPREAILWSGALVCPVLHLLAVFAAAWAARPLWPGVAAWFAAVLLLGHGAALAYSVVGRADHHTLVLLAAVVTLGAGMRAVVTTDRSAQAWLAGGAGGFGLWVSPEALLAVAPLLGGFGLAWALAWDGRGGAAQGLRAALGAALVVTIAITTERPQAGWWAIEQDRVSVQHLALMGAAALVFLLVLPLARLRRRLRIPLGLLVSGAAGLVLHTLWPSLWSASLAAADPTSAVLLLPVVSEMQPLRLGSFAGIAEAALWAGLAPLGLLALLLGLLYGGWVRNGRWKAALMLGLALAAAAAAALLARRFALDLAAPAALAAAGLLPMLGRLLLGPARVLALALGALALFGLPLMSRWVEGPPPTAATCPVAQFADVFARHPAVPGATMVADQLNDGPELAWRTGLRQLAAPYHRGGAALADTRAILADTSEEAEEARVILALRGASLLLLCRGAGVLGGPLPPGSLRERLLVGAAPEGFSEVQRVAQELPHYRLFSLD